jgi:methionyl-tRNA synthetase
MGKFNRFTVTAALPYANGPKHIGHLAGAYIPADVYVRYLRSAGKDVLFVSGSDEHGTAIPNQALKEGTTPRKIIDKYHRLIKDCFDALGISFDVYHRTSEPVHHETSQEFFLALHDKGLLEENVSEQYYDDQAKAFLADRYIIGTCPNCGNASAYGDQCEKCGSTLSPRELINPKSTLTGNVPVLRETKHWYLPLHKYEAWLAEWILRGHAKDWKPNVFGQCKSWIDAGLQSRAMTRDLDWGIKVPLPGADGKVLYVWFDAPIGYISATRAFFTEMAAGVRNFAQPQRDFGTVKEDDWRTYWQAKDTKLVHFIGKDNIVFHCIIFPIMLQAHGDYIVPENVPANEFMNLEGDKMSTSRGWSIEMHEYLEDFPGKPDVLRYCLLANLPEVKDSEFTWKDFQSRNNNELVAIYGNFVNRALVLTQKFFQGKVPTKGHLETIDQSALEGLNTLSSSIGTSLESYRFREATAAMMDIARLGNKYLADTEPWKVFKIDPSRVGTILNVTLQIVGTLSILSKPFLPFTATRIANMLNIPEYTWSKAGHRHLIPDGNSLGEPELLFEKIEDATIAQQVEKLHAKKNAATMGNSQTRAIKPHISSDDFSKLDLRIARVVSAEKVPKSDKLLKLTVDTGVGHRVVLSGIGKHFEPQTLIGKQVTILVNLAPRKMMGIESNGMILTVEDQDGSLRLLHPSEIVTPGATIS